MIMDEKRSEHLLQSHGIRPTANRIVIIKALADIDRPLSMAELEAKILTIDKSGIYRSLMLFKQHHLVHTLEDGRGEMVYELCRSHGEDDDDRHVHFFCEHCRQSFCMEEIAIPQVAVREGFIVNTVNYMLKGICPNCAERIALGK